MPWGESAPPKKDGACVVGEGLSTESLVAVPSALFQELQTQVSPHATLFCSILSLPEPRDFCKGHFVYLPLKRAPLPLEVSCPFLGVESLLIFTDRGYMDASSSSGVLGCRTLHEVETSQS